MTHKVKEMRVVEEHAYYCQQTLSKRWFGNMNMT